MPLDDVIDRLKSDKKHGKDFYTLILVAPSGQVELRRLPRTDETIARVRQALERMIERYG
jgi:3-dehydroquinate synthase